MATIVDAQAGRDTPEAYVETFEALLADAFRELLAGVTHSLPEQSGADFMPASRDLFARAGKEPDQASLMGMALYLRRLYEYFFNHIL